MEESKLFKSLNTDIVNALHNVYTCDTTHKQLEALTILSEKLIDNTRDPYLKQLIEFQYQLEEANLCFKFKKTVKMTSLYKSMMIADALEDDERIEECISNLAYVVNTNQDLRIKCIEKCISELVESKTNLN